MINYLIPSLFSKLLYAFGSLSPVALRAGILKLNYNSNISYFIDPSFSIVLRLLECFLLGSPFTPI